MKIGAVETGTDRASFTVTSCTFPALCASAGMPEIATLFCEVDAHYFGGVDRDLALERPHTLAGGGPNCPFSFSWRE